MGVHQASLVLPLSSWDVSQGERTVDTWTRLSLSTLFSLPENSLTRRPRNRKCDRFQTLDTTQTQSTDIEKQTGQVASLLLGSWSSGWSRRSRTSPQMKDPRGETLTQVSGDREPERTRRLKLIYHTESLLVSGTERSSHQHAGVETHTLRLEQRSADPDLVCYTVFKGKNRNRVGGKRGSGKGK